MENGKREAQSAREQAAKTRSGANGPQGPQVPEAGLRRRRDLDAVAEGARRDKRTARVKCRVNFRANGLPEDASVQLDGQGNDVGLTLALLVREAAGKLGYTPEVLCGKIIKACGLLEVLVNEAVVADMNALRRELEKMEGEGT